MTLTIYSEIQDEIDIDESMSTISRNSNFSNLSNTSTSGTSGLNKKQKTVPSRSVQSNIQNFIGRNFLPCEENKFNTLLLRMMVSMVGHSIEKKISKKL